MKASKRMEEAEPYLMEAIQEVESGRCSKFIMFNGIKVYKCKNIIRIDIKEDVEDER